MRTVAWVLALSVLPACGGDGGPAAPRAEHGVLDLRAWDFEKDGPVALDGDWEAWWSRLVPPGELPASPSADVLPFPGPWSTGRLADGTVPDDLGYGTFRLTVRLPPEPADDPWTLVVNGHAVVLDVLDTSGRPLAGETVRGKVATDAASWTSFAGSTELSLAPADGDVVELVLRTANFKARTARWSPGVIAPKSVVTAKYGGRRLNLAVISGVILVMGLYHLVLWGMRRTERTPLWFGLFCVFLGGRELMMSELLETRFPTSDVWLLHERIEYTGFYMAVGLFGMFLRSIFPSGMPRWPTWAVMAIALAATLPTYVLGSVEALDRILGFMELFALPVAAFYVACLGRVLWRGEDRTLSGLILVGTVVQAGCAVNDILMNRHLIQSISVEDYGIFGFIFFQAMVLAVSNQRARTRAEQLAAELDEKNAALRRMDALKDEFLANTSHELRTPLNGIIGLTESLLDGATGALAEPTRRSLRMIVASGRRLADLVNDILDFAKLRHDTISLQPKPVDARATVDLVLALSKPIAAKKRIELTNRLDPETPPVLADENRFQQILLNLVGNAIKFTPAGGAVDVSSRVVGRDVLITVTDTGIGIPKDAQAKIFEPFVQADGSTAREYGGTGLGLPITRQLVGLHGGRITVESEPGRGAAFTFTLPVADEPAVTGARKLVPVHQDLGEDEPTPNPTPREARFRVLAVDDDPINLAVVSNQLATAGGWSVVQAQSGQDALALLDQERFDAVVLDIMMPRMTGYEVCRELRRKFPANELPVLLLTARNQEGDLVQGFDAGANDYLVKPFGKKELVSRLHTHVSLAKKNVAYGRFVPHEFLRLLGKDDVVDVDLGDQVQKEMTVLFCDIRSFTAMSEQMTVSETFRFLNACLERIGPVVRDCGGFVDKYIGDAVMALFPRSPDDAIEAAVRIAREVDAYNAGEPGRVVGVGIGVHSGSMMLGTIGEALRMEGTVISDAVNLASRLEGITRRFGVTTIVSEDTLSRVRDRSRHAPRFLGVIRVVGKKRNIAVFELTASDPADVRAAKERDAEAFTEALGLFRQGRLADAEAAFHGILDRNPGDGPAKRYAEQCRALLDEGVPDGWDGVLEFDRK